ncbi:MAG: universal stress protein [Actinomycetaceae bacterium]|nr:universal stress protein [Actinomycetaceae bacterium]
MSFKHDNVVVCGVDGSDASVNALVWAAEEAKTRNALLDILCCYQEPTYSGHRGAVGINEEQAHQILESAREAVSGVGVDVQVSLEAEDPTTALLERSKKVARVVVGARGGSGGFADRLLGSVSSTLAARGYCAVVIVPDSKGRQVVPAKHIVCGVDGSETSRNALELAVREAARWGAKLSCVSTINLGASMWIPGPGYHQEVLDDVRAGLKETVASASQGYDVNIQCHVIEGNPAALLSEFSTVVDLLVVGTRGRGGFAGLLLGSTSQTVLHHAQCPMLIVPRRTRDNEDAPWSNVPWSRTQQSQDGAPGV